MNQPIKKFIVYYRVSTKRQGASGLGLDAQRHQVAEFVRTRGAEILDEFTEVESGTNDERPQLHAALNAASLYGVPLLIAKLDRLSRSAAFLMALQESGVEFTCVDMPDVCDMTIGVMALVARQERDAISKRTQAALEQAKARGVVLGGVREGQRALSEDERRRGARIRRESCIRKAEQYRLPITRAISAGYDKPHTIAQALQDAQIPTPRGKKTWQGVQVQRLLKLLDTTVTKIRAEQERLGNE